MTKEFPTEVVPVKEPAVYAFELRDVKLLDGPFKCAMDLSGAWMKSLEPDRLLAWFYKTAGLKPKSETYGGWAKSAGHPLGHYLSACAMRYASTEDEEIKERINYIVDELAICLDAPGDGFLVAYADGRRITREEVAKGDTRASLNKLRVPWYIYHKVMAGLRDTYVYTQNQKALTVLTKMADWTIEITSPLTEEQWQQMLIEEYGGMMEVLADVYVLTGEKEYLVISKKFYDKVVMDPLSRKQDSLSGWHANTQIPKAIGAVRIYELTGEEKYGTLSRCFWETVVNHYTFVNGGNSASEFFGRPDKLSELMHHTTETCNSYNMLKLTRHLYALRPQKMYMDYYERALWNHILAHQNCKTGMVIYKGILDMPARKNYSTPFDSFWCCVGTGFESHNKYGECIWGYGADGLYLNQFIASELNWKDKGLTVKLETDFPESDTIKLTFVNLEMTCPLKIRKPVWAEGATCTINDRPQEISSDNMGYFVFNHILQGDVLMLKLPMKIHVETMPDKPDRMAFLYGPIVLAADLSGNDPLPPMPSNLGPLPADLIGGDPLPMLQGTSKELAAKIRPVPGTPLEFIGEKISKDFEENAAAEDVRLIPLYKIINEKYTVYMDTFTDQDRREMLQAERDLNVASESMITGQHAGRTWYQVENGGWVAFDLETAGEGPQELVLTFWYWLADKRLRKFDILVDGVRIASESLKCVRFLPFTDITYSIPERVTRGKGKIRVKLAAKPDAVAGGLYGAKIISRNVD